MDSQQAIDTLGNIFAAKRAAGAHTGSTLRVGVFGNGLPSELLLAASCLPVDVKMAPEGDLGAHVPAIDPYIEPFVDDYARIFLHRLFGGAFADLATVIFCRDDAAALVAYQYALELDRQGIADTNIPKLILWNLVHRDTDAAVEFNRLQADRLWTDLAAVGADKPVAESLARAAHDTARQREALAALDTDRKGPTPRLSGLDVMRWRNAGRYMPPGAHADLLADATKAVAVREPRSRSRRLALIGAPTDSGAFYETIEAFGTIVTDLQPFGDVWPGPAATPVLDDILRAEATDPFCPRTEPAGLHRDAIVGRCVADGCDAVIAQLDQHDDSIGWDLPSLRKSLSEKGIPLIELGFRDHRPDGAWLAQARAKLAVALGDAP